jgi:aminoglycoside phosphotransferase (APT) family kinase protein
MIPPPTFSSHQEYILRRTDVNFWRPYVAELLARHDLRCEVRDLVSGVGGTYPTLLCGDVVVKLFGGSQTWSKAYEAERSVHALLATDPQIRAPRVLAAGSLYDDPDAPWPYLVSTRMPGVSWQHAGLSAAQKTAVAADLGEQIRRVHALRPTAVATHEEWLAIDVTAAAAQSSLPPHLVDQVDAYLAALPPPDTVFVNGDIMFRHVFVDGGRLTGIIDWGDALVTDRHYEFAKMHLDLFDNNKGLLRTFLEASSWPAGEDFARRALGYALYRQAHGLTQHHSMDVFYTIPERFPLQQIATLHELADTLFSI